MPRAATSRKSLTFIGRFPCATFSYQVLLLDSGAMRPLLAGRRAQTTTTGLTNVGRLHYSLCDHPKCPFQVVRQRARSWDCFLVPGYQEVAGL